MLEFLALETGNEVCAGIMPTNESIPKPAL